MPKLCVVWEMVESLAFREILMCVRLTHWFHYEPSSLSELSLYLELALVANALEEDFGAGAFADFD